MQWRDFKHFLRRIPVDLHPRIEAAWALGEHKHAGQKRKSGEPYFAHPSAVAAMLAELGADADTVIAALLHDTVEDTDLTLPEIKKQFGSTVAKLIEGVTKLTADELEEKASVNEQVETLRKIFTLMQDDVRIMVIKIIDRLHNMQTVSFLSEKSRQMLARETMDVYVKIADRLCMQDTRDELEGYCRAVLEPDTFPTVYKLKRENRRQGRAKVKLMRSAIQSSAFQPLLKRTKLMFEHKSWDQLQTLLQTEGSAVTGNAGINVVFVCDDLDTCYQALGALHQLWLREVLSFQDFINAPAINGYRGLHTTVILSDGTRVRCKIRTKEMHEYARRGVTTLCFLPSTSSLAERLPWTQRISPLSDATVGRSNDFWDSLQNDILGESILIHGPADETVLIPNQATALDGAFFLFHEQALRLETIKVNGQAVPFQTPLAPAISLDVTLADTVTVDRGWLDYVKTGLAAAAIRSALSKMQTKEERVKSGREMLQNILTQKKKGFIEEFDDAKLLTNLGGSYASMRDVFAAIAEGALQPNDVYISLFERPSETSREQPTIITYAFNADDAATNDRVNTTLKKYGTKLKEIRQRRNGNTPFDRVTSNFLLSVAEADRLAAELQHSGATNVEIVRRSPRDAIILTVIIILWGLNPVIAKWLLLQGVHVLALVNLRLLTLAMFNIGYFVVWRLLRWNVNLQPIRHAWSIAILPTVGLIGMTFCNYIALSFLPPSAHLTILRFNTLLLPTLALTNAKASMRRPLEMFVLLLVATIAAFIVILGEQVLLGLLVSVLGLISYTWYSLTTEHALQRHKIGARQPFFVLQTGIVLGIAGLLMLPFETHDIIASSWTVLSIVYVALCVALPHILYTILLRKIRFKHFSDFLIMEIPIAMALETLLIGIVLPYALYAAIALVIAALIFLRRKTFMMPMSIPVSFES